MEKPEDVRIAAAWELHQGDRILDHHKGKWAVVTRIRRRYDGAHRYSIELDTDSIYDVSSEYQFRMEGS